MSGRKKNIRSYDIFLTLYDLNNKKEITWAKYILHIALSYLFSYRAIIFLSSAICCFKLSFSFSKSLILLKKWIIRTFSGISIYIYHIVYIETRSEIWYNVAYFSEVEVISWSWSCDSSILRDLMLFDLLLARVSTSGRAVLRETSFWERESANDIVEESLDVVSLVSLIILSLDSNEIVLTRDGDED